jgi:hypothetical protein
VAKTTRFNKQATHSFGLIIYTTPFQHPLLISPPHEEELLKNDYLHKHEFTICSRGWRLSIIIPRLLRFGSSAGLLLGCLSSLTLSNLSLSSLSLRNFALSSLSLRNFALSSLSLRNLALSSLSLRNLALRSLCLSSLALRSLCSLTLLLLGYIASSLVRVGGGGGLLTILCVLALLLRSLASNGCTAAILYQTVALPRSQSLSRSESSSRGSWSLARLSCASTCEEV